MQTYSLRRLQEEPVARWPGIFRVSAFVQMSAHAEDAYFAKGVKRPYIVVSVT